MADVLALPALSVFLARDPLAVFCHALYTSGGDKRGANNLEGRRHCQIHAHPPEQTHIPQIFPPSAAHTLDDFFLLGRSVRLACCLRSVLTA